MEILRLHELPMQRVDWKATLVAQLWYTKVWPWPRPASYPTYSTGGIYVEVRAPLARGHFILGRVQGGVVWLQSSVSHAVDLDRGQTRD